MLLGPLTLRDDADRQHILVDADISANTEVQPNLCGFYLHACPAACAITVAVVETLGIGSGHSYFRNVAVEHKKPIQPAVDPHTAPEMRP